jgi:F-type H+-transporting ATPase subunit gamma
MAGGQERILRRRIRSVQSTKKITRAMELIAASRIVRAQGRVESAVPYSEQITEVVHDLADAGGVIESPLLVPRPEIRRVGHIVVTADRGLCGAYNSSVLRAAEGEIEEHREVGRDSSVYVVGRKGESYFRYRGLPVEASFTGFSDQPSYEDARTIAAAVAEPFLDGRIDMVQVIYTRFITVGSQEVVVRPLMPLEREIVRDEDERAREAETARAAYEFEPGPGEILERLLPRYVEARVFAALLNAAASEHAARQRAMKSATDNAEDLITSLTRVMNRARQDAITTEIMEVVGGAEALRKGKRLHAEDLLVDSIEGRRTDLFAKRVQDDN